MGNSRTQRSASVAFLRQLSERGAVVAVLLVVLVWTDGAVAQSSFKRGDVNADGEVNVTDPVALLNYLFAAADAPPCKDAADVDDGGSLNVTDAVRLLLHLFAGGLAPESPFEECGEDPTDGDGLGCEAFEPCGGQGIPAGFTSIGDNEEGYPEYTHDQTGIVFVLLPGGTFDMGSPDDGSECKRWVEEGPVHEVTLSPFLIAKYELTQGQWFAVMGTYPSWFDGTEDWDGNPVIPPDDRDQLPVEQVTWDDIQLFEAETGLTLPTEAQWEYACRAGTRTAFWFGSLLAADEANFNPNWDSDECRAGPGEWRLRTIEVGSLPPNGFGLHDMHGNVWEWCEDVFDSTFYSKPEAAGPDPLSTSGSEGRVLRGGSWIDLARGCRSAYRYEGHRSIPRFLLGYRPARPLRE